MVLGTFLKVRRKRILEKQTAHLKRASAIWDFADSNTGSSRIDAANEKAANERGDAAPFQPRRQATQHSRNESRDSDASAEDAVSLHSHPSKPQMQQVQASNPYDRAVAQQMPRHAPPPQHQQSVLSYTHPMQRAVNRLSSIAAFQNMGMARSAPQPPGPPRVIEYGGLQPQMRLPMGREDSFGARAHQASPPRNVFFPPPQPQGQLVMPGTSI